MQKKYFKLQIVFTRRHGGRVGVPKQRNGGHIVLFHWTNMAAGHASENDL